MITPATAPKVRLRVARGASAGTRIRLRGPSFRIGREPNCDLRPGGPLVIRYHAMIDVTADAVVLCDPGSRNGTLLNGRPITEPTPVEDGDRIEVGPLEFVASIRRPGLAPAPDDQAGETDDPAGRFDEPTPDPTSPGTRRPCSAARS